MLEWEYEVDGRYIGVVSGVEKYRVTEYGNVYTKDECGGWYLLMECFSQEDALEYVTVYLHVDPQDA